VDGGDDLIPRIEVTPRLVWAQLALDDVELDAFVGQLDPSRSSRTGLLSRRRRGGFVLHGEPPALTTLLANGGRRRVLRPDGGSRILSA
jgi:hypothetical protein